MDTTEKKYKLFSGELGTYSEWRLDRQKKMLDFFNKGKKTLSLTGKRKQKKSRRPKNSYLTRKRHARTHSKEWWLTKKNGPVITNNVKEPIFYSYKEYLLSDHWRATRKKVRLQRGGRCERCQSSRSLVVHHGSYAHVGSERDDELFLLCEDCHTKLHETFRKPKTSSRFNKRLLRFTRKFLCY